MKANYGYKDGSGDFFIMIDTDKCDGCAECFTACPAGVLECGEDQIDPMRDEPVAFVSDGQRKQIKYACALSQLANLDETIEVPSVGDRPPRRLARQTLAEVVEPRYEELFTLIRDELRRSGFEDMVAAGVVLTGGSSKMEGAVELAEEVFHMPVRLGLPQHVRGLGDVVRNPIHATGVGLLLYARNRSDSQFGDLPVGGSLHEVWERMKAWFQGNF